MTNTEIAARLLDHARALAQGSQLFHARAYRHAAFVIQGLDSPVDQWLVHHGRRALEEIPGIGRHLSFTIATLATTGELVAYADRKRSPRQLDPAA